MATTEELRAHFGLKTAYSLLSYVKAHLEEINSDGEHAVMKKGVWSFDETAVKRLEELRGFGISTGIVNKVTEERLQERDQIIANLQTRLLSEATGRADAMAKVAELTNKLLLLTEGEQQEKITNAVLQKELELIKAEKEQLVTEKTTLQKQLESQENSQAELIASNRNLQKQLENKEEELTTERNRHWWKIWKK